MRNIALIIFLIINYQTLAQVTKLRIDSDRNMPTNSFADSIFFSKLGIQPEDTTITITQKKFKWKFPFIGKVETSINRKYFRFYENQLNYLESDDSGLDEFYLGFAYYFKMRKQQFITERDQEVIEVFDQNFEVDSDPGDIRAFEENRANIITDYDDEIEFFHNKSVEYWFHYRNLRGIQGPAIKGNDKALRTALFYENNVLNKDEKFLNSLALTYGFDNNISLFSELYRDYISVFRISVGTLIANQGSVNVDSSATDVIDQSERREQTIQRLIGGGGNIIGSVSYPIFHFRTKNESYRVLGTINIRPSLDVPILGTVEEDFNFNIYNYQETSIVVSGLNKDISLLATNSFGYFDANDSYYDYLKLEENNGIRNKGMWLGSFQFGILLGKIFQISYTSYYGNSFARNMIPGSISLGLITK